MENVIAAECFREPQEGDDFVPCPIVWSGECGCASNYRLHESLKNAPVILWLAPDIPTPTPHLWGEQQCHEWTTYPHKTLPKKKKKPHTFIAQEKMHWIRIQFCPTDVHSSEKSLHFPHSTQLSIWKLP